MVIILEGERPTYSLNAYWAGMHWRKRKKEADRIHSIVHACIPDEAKMYTRPVYIAAHVYFDKRPFDADNIVPKPYIDALKGRIIKDDDMRYLLGVVSYPYIDKQRPRVELEITEAKT